MITLVIVDCQNDFISGSMSVKGAKNAIDKIKEFIINNKGDIDKILLTVDWHPYNHCSFKKEGGKWPVHCVQYTAGACIEPKLLKLIQSLDITYEVCQKGEIPYREQYGAFEEIEYVEDEPISHYYFDSLYTADANTDFVICGIAGDYCVKETIQNLINFDISVKVLKDGVISIDDGSTFNKFIDDNKLEII